MIISVIFLIPDTSLTKCLGFIRRLLSEMNVSESVHLAGIIPDLTQKNSHFSSFAIIIERDTKNGVNFLLSKKTHPT